MRLEYGFELSKVEIPRFSVEAVEGIGKLFTLAAQSRGSGDQDRGLQGDRQRLPGGRRTEVPARFGRPGSRLVQLLSLDRGESLSPRPI